MQHTGLLQVHADIQTNIMRLIYLFINSIFFANVSLGQTWQDTVASIEKAFSRYQSEKPGCQLSISRNGEIIFSKAWGMADLEHNIALTTTSIIEAGSVSKQFTAASILLLEQQGKLSLDDDVRKYISELPDYGTPLKLRHLIHHTSGLRDWGAVANLTGWGRWTKAYSNEDALEIISRQKSLNNKPGDEFIYSNSNYNLLAILVQRISGMSLAEFSRKYIFEPADMTNTQWRDNPNRVVLNRAIAYKKTKDGFETNMPNEFVYGNGGLLTTTEDLLKWNNFYLLGKLGTASLRFRQTMIEPFNNGAMSDYGAGLFIQNIMGWKSIWHDGSTASYKASLEVFPDLNLSIAFLSNSSEFDTSKTDVLGIIRSLFVMDKSEKLAQKETKIELTELEKNAYTGWYRNERDGSGMQIVLRNNNLMIDNRVQLIPFGKNQFLLGDNMIIISDTKGLRYVIPNKDTITYTKVKPGLFDANNFKRYEGKYFSEETNSFIKVYQHSDKLVLHLKANKDFELTPTYKDAFSIDSLRWSLYFTSNKNEISTMKISIPRARNVEFRKLK